MTISGDDVRELTAKLSGVARQAAYAGLGLIWIFKTGDETNYHLDRSLLGRVLLALALAFDLAQYVATVALRWRHARVEERTRGIDYHGKDITLPAASIGFRTRSSRSRFRWWPRVTSS